MWCLKLGRKKPKGLCAVLVLAGAVIGLVACKEKAINISYSAYIIGASNDIKPLNQETSKNVADKAIQATVLVTTKRNNGSVKFCTGSLIAPESNQELPRVITNHHCFAEIDQSGLATDKLMPEACSNTLAFIDFNFKTGYKGEQIACATDSLRTSSELDLAVFTLSRKISRGLDPLTFFKGSEADIKAKSALIIHFPTQTASTVKSSVLGVELPQGSITEANCQAIGFFDEDEKALDPILKVGIRHTCDLVHGSSGSALIDRDSGTILGINWGGIKIQRGQELMEVNVATWAKYAEDFVNGRKGDIHGEANATLGQSSSKAVVKMSEEKGGGPKKNFMTKAKEKVSCGSIGSAETGNREFLEFVLICLFLLPLAIAGTMSSRKRVIQ